ncbi:IclR family transcriptional regulator [Muricomes intestini]|jgi:DNA-binding IclR family transcriptional regulator|uniref:IclR family transcriptional regulator n=2 Tax=Muricomes intestini TaxID=1796634 RepID=A0A4R3K3N2_9FIRM|nr:IclR family transcriptional regulator [Muricomes intestini]TCS77334.1 IclR family transcriptional regulator [Muricomes intestini]HAX51019.1 IclR family transcriptional regulator [Lachnospiraceae bacterium]HCR82797.1 IclR family transcriptional regulator [Lachnospiraceae bacterium]
MGTNAEIKIKSLQKALEVLNCFSSKPTLGVTEISEQLGLYKSNVHNILSTFQAMNYLEKDEESDKYKLGMGIFTLSRALGDTFAITKIAMPYMQELANITNTRVYLAIPHNNEVVYLEAMYPAESTHLMRSMLGERADMHCTGLGKAMLANMSQKKIASYLERDLTAYTDQTITDKDAFYKELLLIKQRGYAVDDMEHEFGIKCVALPIFDKSRNLYAAISISGSYPQFTEDQIRRWAILIKKYVDKIEQRL